MLHTIARGPLDNHARHSGDSPSGFWWAGDWTAPRATEPTDLVIEAALTN